MAGASENTFLFQLVSPDCVLAEEPVQMAVLPASEGEIGVLAGHIPFLTSLRPGVAVLKDEKGDERRIFLSGGFVDVTQDQCTVLAESAVNVNDLKQSGVEAELSNLKEDLDMAEDTLEKDKIEKKIKTTKAKLTAITGELVF